MALKISQQDNFNNEFGDVFRSSAIFYFVQGPETRTTISFMNYWFHKRGTTVSVVASLREMSGKLVKREKLGFEQGSCVNYRPMIEDSDFEGSVEIEVFAASNLVIPYAAVMGVYETKHGITMVHSYARTYYPFEIEEGRMITDGEEACWSLRDSNEVTSFGVFHNGLAAQPKQTVTLEVTNAKNSVRKAEWEMPELAPYAVAKIEPREQIPGLVDFLDGRPGQARISFVLNKSFTRMLVGNQRLDGSDLQVTHSNFNYSRHRTDHVEADNPTAYMYVPHLDADTTREVVIFPDCDPGDYHVRPVGFRDEQSQGFSSGQTLDIALAGNGHLEFSKRDGQLPSRIVTALRTSKNPERIPAECSLGVLHEKRPPKTFWWGLCAADAKRDSRIFGCAAEPVYGRYDDQTITLKLYSSGRGEVLEAQVGMEDLRNGVDVRTVFEDTEGFLAGDLGWFSFLSEYNGFLVYSSLETPSGSFCLEHGF